MEWMNLFTVIVLLSVFTMLLFVLSLVLEKKAAWNAAEGSRRRYDSIFEHNPDMACLFSGDGRLLRLNPAAERLTGYCMAELEGSRFWSIIDPADSRQISRCFLRAKQGQPLTAEMRIHTKDGRMLELSTVFVPWTDGRGEADIYTISKDLTPRNTAQRELWKAKTEAEKALKIKGEFLAVMSHEIRTPLNGVLGMSELLLDTELSEEQQQYIGIIHSSGASLLEIIDDVLDYSRLESAGGSIPLAESPFLLRDVVVGSLQLFISRLREKKLQAILELDPDLPEVLIGDENRLRQVLNNLIGNAVKFTEQGGISVKVKELERSAERIQLEFRIQDTGIGVPKDKLHLLFKPFSQSDSSISRIYGGTGLGLAICKTLVERMGGKIALNPLEKGAEAVFRISVGYSAASAAGEREENAAGA
ncbi:ATP-binding protein [Paenibacillus pasadenensis]|uniref:PAS domain-containing hybrid sensor histidine kinase/response regulator n=1 Tax=Paenibacillus pasadenensis TaxID=217090 RepID=UPI0020407714|nr:ATP-binding protein [Paenibacillus pasadenensis]MCM3748378.1 ATP-binding protein [Paenibacillus pasadenensis]